jgi:hypothetical protein
VERTTLLLLYAPFAQGFSQVGKAFLWRPLWGFHWLGEMNAFQSFHAIKDVLERLVMTNATNRAVARYVRFRDLLTQAQALTARVGHEAPEVGDLRPEEEIVSSELDRCVRQAVLWARTLDPADKDVHCLQATAAYLCLRRALVQVRQGALAVLFITLMLVVVASTSIQGHSLAAVLVIVLTFEVALVFVLILMLERNILLSMVAGSTPGKVDWNSGVLATMAQPVLILGLGFLLTHFPATATLLQMMIP